MKKVFIVTYGDYSDYHIRAVFSTKKDANKLAKKYGGNVEEYTLDECLPKINSSLTQYVVFMKRDGSTVEVRAEFDYLEKTNAYIERYGNQLVVSCMAGNKRHAIKIASEQRAQFIANNAWPTDEKHLEEKVKSYRRFVIGRTSSYVVPTETE